MRRLATSLVLAAVMLGTTQPGQAAELTRYEVRLEAAEAGPARGVATIEIAGANEGRLAIPLGVRAEQVELVQAPAGTVIQASRVNGQTLVAVTLPASAGGAGRIALRFTVTATFEEAAPAAGEKRTLPVGHRLFRHVLVNTQPASIGHYSFELVFPPGMRAHAIREALPKLRKAEVGPRVQFDRVEGRIGARLQADRLQQGDTASMQLELMPATRSAGWLVAGLVLSLLYLVYFRDLVARKRPEPQA